MSDYPGCPCAEVCALRKALSSIGGKWKLPVLCSLMVNGPSRYNILLKNIQGISNTMLSQTLKELEADHLITRYEYMEVPIRVEYSLTDKGNRLKPIMEQMIAWSLSEESN